MSWYPPSPPGGSTLTTSAPSSASRRAASGPAQKLDMSTITRCRRARRRSEPCRRPPTRPECRRRGRGPAGRRAAAARAPASSTDMNTSLTRACSWPSHSSSVLHFADRGRRVEQRLLPTRRPSALAEAARQLVEHARVIHAAVGEPPQRLGAREVEPARRRRIEPDEPAHLAPAFGAAEVDLHAAAVARLVRVQDRSIRRDGRSPRRRCARWKIGRRVQEQQAPRTATSRRAGRSRSSPASRARRPSRAPRTTRRRRSPSGTAARSGGPR